MTLKNPRIFWWWRMMRMSESRKNWVSPIFQSRYGACSRRGCPLVWPALYRCGE